MPHPDYLLPYLTWEHVRGWQEYWSAEPWGELRADERAAANTLWNTMARESNDLPELIYPYFKDAEALWQKHQELDQKRKELGPEHEAKLKAARQKYWEEKRLREGK